MVQTALRCCSLSLKISKVQKNKALNNLIYLSTDNALSGKLDWMRAVPTELLCHSIKQMNILKKDCHYLVGAQEVECTVFHTY